MRHTKVCPCHQNMAPSDEHTPESPVSGGKDTGTQTVADSQEAPKDGGYLTKEQLEAVVVVINGVILAQAASPYTLKDAHDLYEACKDEKEGSALAAGVQAAQRKSPFTLENAHALFEAVNLLVQKDGAAASPPSSNK